MLHRIPRGKTGLIDWLALYTTAEVKKLRKDGQLVKTEDEYLVITEGGLWRVEYVGAGKKKEVTKNGTHREQWSTLYDLVREAREQALEMYAEMRAEATPDGSPLPDGDKLNKNPDYKILEDHLGTLEDIQVELENQKI